MADGCEVKLTVDDFGELVDAATSTRTPIKRYTWSSKACELQAIGYGATITSLRTLDRFGKRADVVMGFDSLDGGYLLPENPYFGATIGRCANRIRAGAFSLGGHAYALARNAPGGASHLNGGVHAWDKRAWDVHVSGRRVTFSLLSPHADEGYPGACVASVAYELQCPAKDTAVLRVMMRCATTRPTPVNMTSHSYFNLAGHDAGSVQLYSHEFLLNSDSYAPLDADLVATGRVEPIASLDGDGWRELAQGGMTGLHKFMPHDGIDSHFCVRSAGSKEERPAMATAAGTRLIAKVAHPISGRTMEMYGNQPGVQFYTANFLPKPDERPLIGKAGKHYVKHGAFCLAPQGYPNAVNIPIFPSVVLNPDQIYEHEIIYKFGIDKK